MSSVSFLLRGPKPTTNLLCFVRIFNRPMGGGPRTFPGGLSKWQWKRMHEKRAKEKEKRLLDQEKQLYQARIRSQIRAKLHAKPDQDANMAMQSTNIHHHNPISPQEHIKALANRFMREGAEDLWNEDDGLLKSEQEQPGPTGAANERPRVVGLPIGLRSLKSDNRNRGNVSSDNVYSSKFMRTRKYSVNSGTWFRRNESSGFSRNSVGDDSKTLNNSRNSSGTMNKWRDFSRNGSPSTDLRSVIEYTKSKVGGGRRRFKRNESSSSDDDDLDLELEEVDEKVEGWTEVKRLGSRASLGKYDMKITKRVPLKNLEKDNEFSEQVELIRKEISRNKLVENAGEENGKEEAILSQKR